MPYKTFTERHWPGRALDIPGTGGWQLFDVTSLLEGLGRCCGCGRPSECLITHVDETGIFFPLCLACQPDFIPLLTPVPEG